MFLESNPFINYNTEIMDDRIQKYFNDELPQPEKLSFLREVETNESLRRQFVDAQNTRALLNLSPDIRNDQVTQRYYNQFIRQTQREKIRKKFSLWIKYAAVIAVLMTLSSVVTYYFTEYEQPSLMVETEWNTLYTPAGQRVRLVLQDGTEVWLNAKSSLTYPASFAGQERRVKIEGEAFFHVAKDSLKPFIVSAPDIDIKVLGTRFNVYSYADAGFSNTSLLDGSVQVYFRGNEKNGIVLQPFQQVTVKDGKMTVRKLPSTDHFLWREGIYAFEEEPLINIIRKMELYYDVKIIVKDPSRFNDPYTGKFRQRDSLDDVFRILQQIRPFRVHKDPENNIITLSK